MAALIRAHGSPPCICASMLAASSTSRGAGLRLRLVFCSGGSFPRSGGPLHERVDADLHNLYGPTESGGRQQLWRFRRGAEPSRAIAFRVELEASLDEGSIRFRPASRAISNWPGPARARLTRPPALPQSASWPIPSSRRRMYRRATSPPSP
jgi:hypothetical protein